MDTKFFLIMMLMYGTWLADTGGCRVLDINRYIASLVHNRALLISRHLKWYHRPTAYIYLLRLVASYAFTYRNPGLFRLFAKTYKEGYKKEN
ncbi:hypothetical protein NXV57_27640 [Bacteroides thetaiotaomicron]|nr:hypothetical protein [Bacteroides thetaiotaomicron]